MMVCLAYQHHVSLVGGGVNLNLMTAQVRLTYEQKIGRAGGGVKVMAVFLTYERTVDHA